MKSEVVVGILGLGISVATLGHRIYEGRQTKLLVGRESRFFCALQADPTRGGDVWSVMYRRGRQEAKPWLRMVRTMGSGWDTKNRCAEIAERLETYRQDGLLGFEYRSDPDTPEQYVICAKTQLSADSCPLVITLAPEADPYKALHEVAGALLPGRLPSYQCSDEATCPTSKPISINLQNQLKE